MEDRDRRRYDRALRVLVFGTTNAGDFAEGSNALSLFEQLRACTDQIEAAASGQNPERVTKQTLLGELNADFANISRTSKAIALDEPGFSGPYRAPDNPSESARLIHADALLTRLADQPGDDDATRAAKAALRAKFIAYEMPADFVDDLRADTQAIRDANANNRGETLGGVENTALIGVSLDKAAAIVQKLDAIMHNKYARHPEKLRQWQSANHVERAPRKKGDQTTTTTPTQ